jgi:hypothetical protein
LLEHLALEAAQQALGREQVQQVQQVPELTQRAAVAEEEEEAVAVVLAFANRGMPEVDKPVDTAPESSPEVGQHRVTWLEYPCMASLCSASQFAKMSDG